MNKNNYDYLIFTAQEDTIISFDVEGSNDSNLVLSNPISLQYKKNGDKTFNDYTWDGNKKTQVNSVAIGDKISLLAGEVIYFKGANKTLSSNKLYLRFQSTNKIKASGNIMSIMDDKTKIYDYCFSNMFRGCTFLVTAPILPATTLADNCYANMFQDCTSLIVAPELPATTLADNCYGYMFQGCTSLIAAPELPATTLAEWCYYCMFSGCFSLVKAPELPATILADYCYASMFDGCTSLVKAPELPATTLATCCYHHMFASCTLLTSITCLATDISANSCTHEWLLGILTSGIFNCKKQVNWEIGYSGIPKSWKCNYI